MVMTWECELVEIEYSMKRVLILRILIILVLDFIDDSDCKKES